MPIREGLNWFCLSAMLAITNPVFAQVTEYCCDQQARDAYIADLQNLGVPVDTAQESFESGPWVQAASVSLPSVSRLGLTWSRADAGLRTSTGGGNVIDGSYLMFSFDSATLGHAVPDGFRLSGNGINLYGAAGWFRGASAKLAFILDDDPDRVNFTGEEATVISWKFLGFIDPAGFQQLDIQSLDEQGGETKIFFSDDFLVAAEQGRLLPPDDDNDGVGDTIDNCPLLPNPLQTDTDRDAIGNSCDPDFNQDCVVNFADVSEFSNSFLSNNALTDMNGDGIVNFADFILVIDYFLLPPGPGALPNICTAN